MQMYCELILQEKYLHYCIKRGASVPFPRLECGLFIPRDVNKFTGHLLTWILILKKHCKLKVDKFDLTG